MAIARKVIVLDLKLVTSEQVVALGFVTLALGVAYWLVKHSNSLVSNNQNQDHTLN